jgi:hypothetical protein
LILSARVRAGDDLPGPGTLSWPCLSGVGQGLAPLFRPFSSLSSGQDPRCRYESESSLAVTSMLANLAVDGSPRLGPVENHRNLHVYLHIVTASANYNLCLHIYTGIRPGLCVRPTPTWTLPPRTHRPRPRRARKDLCLRLRLDPGGRRLCRQLFALPGR